MFLGHVVGNVTATRKCEQLEGAKFLLIRPQGTENQKQPSLTVAADRVDAGVGDEVIVATGRAARLAFGDEDAPVDAAVIGIVDGKETTGDLLSAKP